MSYYSEIDHPMIIRTKEWGGDTDELMVEFYECRCCLFERVPRGKTVDGRRYVEFDANYCPGCGQPIEWV